MKSSQTVSTILVFFAIQMAGCSGPRAYRDPLTYSFESKTPPPTSQTEWHDLKGKVEETSQKIRSVEERYLW